MAGPLVVDASLLLRLVLPGPEQPRLRDLVTRWTHEGCVLHAPSLWLYEVTSALCRAVYSRALTAEEARRALALLQGLGVESVPLDEAQASLAFDWTLRLGRAAAYDSFYLALAEALQYELWTADERLFCAVGRPRVRWPGDQ